MFIDNKRPIKNILPDLKHNLLVFFDKLNYNINDVKMIFWY